MIKPFLGKRRTERGEEFIRLYNEAQDRQNKRAVDVQIMRRKVWELREEGLIHRKIAERLGIDRTYVTKILNGV